MTAVVEGIPTLLHIAVFLFFLGLIDFLFSINDTIAGIVLGTVFLGVLSYIIVTILPTLRLHCPYRTPLSGICWRLLQLTGWIQYYDPITFSSRRIQGSMSEGRETIATQILPNRYDRDQRALLWTIESLTEDSELEPFVSGISDFLSDSRQGKGSQRISKAMFDILLDKRVSFVERVIKLLKTCQQPTLLAENLR